MYVIYLYTSKKKILRKQNNNQKYFYVTNPIPVVIAFLWHTPCYTNQQYKKWANKKQQQPKITQIFNSEVQQPLNGKAEMYFVGKFLSKVTQTITHNVSDCVRLRRLRKS